MPRSSTSLAAAFSFSGRSPRGWFAPVVVWLILLVVVFVSEYAVMLVLPGVLPADAPRIVETAADSILLTGLVAPVLWWILIRPLRAVLELRTQFLSDLFTQVEVDRRQTAYDLHDGVGQSLTMLISGLRSARDCKTRDEWAARLERFQQLAEDSLTEVRRVTLGLRPRLLDDLGLVPALERLIEDLEGQHGLAIQLDARELDIATLVEPVTTVVFRIVQESLSNVVKHARAQVVRVKLLSAGAKIVVGIEDDGCGMSAERLRSPPSGHLGLRGMEERAALLGGTLVIDSAPGQGTRVLATIPLARAR